MHRDDGSTLHVDEASSVDWERVERLWRYTLDRNGRFNYVSTERRADGLSTEFARAYPEVVTLWNNAAARIDGTLIEEW